MNMNGDIKRHKRNGNPGSIKRHKRQRITKDSKPSKPQQPRSSTDTKLTTFTCSKCGLEVPSRNQLFRHLRNTSNECSSSTAVDNDNTTIANGGRSDEGTTATYVKVILIVAYLGKNYHGCARNDCRDTVLTVEGCLWAAIAGALSEKKYGAIETTPTTTSASASAVAFALDLQKHTNPKSMTRSSRTDKGVSSLGNVYSLLLPDNVLNGDDEDAQLSFASSVNRHLPNNDIRLLRIHISGNGCNKIPSSFNARTCCEARRYRYLVPTKALLNNSNSKKKKNNSNNDDDDEASVTREESIMDLRKRLKQVLLQWGGTHSFHNFTNWKAQLQHQQQPSSSSSSSLAPPSDKNQKEEDHSRHILRCHVEDVTQSKENQDYFVVISIKGQSFLYHMIRKMMGATIGVMNGSLESDFIARALQTPTKKDAGKGNGNGISIDSSSATTIMDVPLAPAEGLVLVECIYSKYCSKHKMEPVGLGTKLLSNGTVGGDVATSTSTRLSDSWERNSAKLVKDTKEFEKRVYEQIFREQGVNYSSL